MVSHLQGVSKCTLTVIPIATVPLKIAIQTVALSPSITEYASSANPTVTVWTVCMGKTSKNMNKLTYYTWIFITCRLVIPYVRHMHLVGRE